MVSVSPGVRRKLRTAWTPSGGTWHSDGLSRTWLERLTAGAPALLWGAGVTLAALQTWAAVRAQSMNADGMAYLDIADAYLQQDWGNAINSVWSPLYSWVLALALRVTGPDVAELVVVHLANFAIFLFAFLAFTFLHRELRLSLSEVGRDDRAVPLWAWDAAAHLLFLYAALALITVWAITPDMLMAGFVCIAAGLIVRIRSGKGGALEFGFLGLALGAGYLAKAVMFPLGFVFLASALLASRGTRARLRRVALAAAVFLVVSIPWIATISGDQGRVTFGDAGRITYLRYVNGIPYPYWKGETPGLGSPAHAPRLVLQHPPVYEFGSPIAGTNPLSFDPAYWYEGAVMQFRPEQQAEAVLRSILYYYDLFVRDLGGTFACILLLCIIAARGRQAAVPDLRRLTLLLPAAAALAFYGLVYVEGRYVGVFALLIFLDALANLRLPLATPRRLVTMSCALMVAFVASGLVVFHLRGSMALQANPVAAGTAVATPASPRAVAESLRQLGIEPGDPVGVIGYAFDSFWARAARVRLVAELQQSDAGALWAGDEEIEARVLAAFSAAGARAVVAEHVPSHAVLPGWQRIGHSSSYLRFLSMPEADSPNPGDSDWNVLPAARASAHPQTAEPMGLSIERVGRRV